MREHHLPHRIDRDAAPVEGAEIAGIDQRALQRRRRVAALVAQLAGTRSGRPAGRTWSTPHMSAPVSGVGLNDSSETGCVGEAWSPSTAPCGAGHFLDRHHRLAGAAVEHDRARPAWSAATSAGTRAAGDGEVDQARLRRHVHVPEVVVHGLEAPSATCPVSRSSATIDEENFSTLALRSPPNWSGVWLPSGT